MNNSGVSGKAHALLVNLFEDNRTLLMQEPNNNWVAYNYQTRRITNFEAPASAEELKNHKLLEKLKYTIIQPQDAPKTTRTAYGLAGNAVAHLEQRIPLARTLIDRAEAFEQQYTLQQYGILRNLSSNPDTNFHEAFLSMSAIAADGQAYQRKTSGRWRIIFKKTNSIPVRATTIERLLEHNLLVRRTEYDDYYERRGYGNCHALSVQAENLLVDSLRGNFDPRDEHLTLETYFDYLGYRYGQQLRKSNSTSARLAFSLSKRQEMLFLIVLHTIVNPQLNYIDPDLNVLYDIACGFVVEEDSTDGAVQTIRQLAAEAAKHVTR